jgi:exodeoxyribonuclease V alpha subunit
MNLEVFEPVDKWDARLVDATEQADSLVALNQAGFLHAADVHTARRLGTAAGEDHEWVLLAIALAVRAVRGGSVCLDLATVEFPHSETMPITPPDSTQWAQAIQKSPLSEVAVRLEGTQLYLDRYWHEEQTVADIVLGRLSNPAPPADLRVLEAAAHQIFPADWHEQRAAALAAATQWTTVITGGPGTGKTTSVAGLLALLVAHSPHQLRIALAAPTGKAAARLQEAVTESATRLSLGSAQWVQDLPALTLHRLLGWRPDSRSRFRHDRRNRLGYDVIVVDESSMVPLTMMARLLEAIRPDTRLVLVGDPDQLTSVEAGAVLADLVAGLGARAPSTVAELTVAHRYGVSIGHLAGAIKAGDADRVADLLMGKDPAITFVDVADDKAVAEVYAELGARALKLQAAAERGDQEAALAALDRHRTLCAHREGPLGVAAINSRCERAIAEVLGTAVGVSWGREWYPGRPILVNTNDYSVGLYNGDVGVAMRHDNELRVVVPDGREFATARLGGVDTMHALTIHKSQGGQADAVTVVVPDAESRLLTRELFYTAVTRARQKVRVVGSLAAVRQAVLTPAVRASGLPRRLIT